MTDRLSPEDMKVVDDMKRKILFTPVADKITLHRWIVEFLGLDMPDTIIDPDSNCTPMDMIWEIYDAARTNKRVDFSRVISYASRDSFKTLACAVLEVLAMVHLRRNVAHMAALESQATKAQSYVKAFLSKPFLRDYLVGSNDREKKIIRYEHRDTGDNLTSKQFASLSVPEQMMYDEVANYIRIIICTPAGANSEHVPFFCVDAKTKILVSPRTEATLASRDRKACTAQGLFARLAGNAPGGRPAAIVTEAHITEPHENIEALSYNFDTGALEFKRIVAGHRRMASTKTVTWSDGTELVCTDDHPLFVLGRGMVETRDLKMGDRVVSINRGRSGATPPADEQQPFHVPSEPVAAGDEWDQVMLGSMLGDGGVYRPSGNAFYKEQHCEEQRAYLEWKVSIISQRVRCRPVAGASGYTGAVQAGFASGHSPLLNPYVAFKDSLEGLERLSGLGLAVWYMDDGCDTNGVRFSTECFSEEQNERLRAFLAERFGINVDVGHYTREGKTYPYLHGGVEAKRRLVEHCAPYVHPDMAYKFSLEGNTKACEVCGERFWFYNGRRNCKTCRRPMCRSVQNGRLHLVSVVSIADAGTRPVYDFTVEGNHNFFANGLLNKNCVDEVDLANPIAYEEAKMIPAPFGDQMPITLLTSTRKYSFGLVQEEIDNAAETGTEIRHWNIIDVTAACPAERHQPELPLVQAYYSDELLAAVDQDHYDQLTPDLQALYHPDTAFAGCLKNCKLFAVCRGRLATKQKHQDVNAKVRQLLKPVTHTQNVLKSVDIETAKAQLLCRKPSTAGLIYPNFDRVIHMKTAAEMAEMITGEAFPPEMSKAQLIDLMQSKGVRFASGMDFGYTHRFAVPTGGIDGNRCFLFDVISVAEIELEQQIEICTLKIKALRPRISADSSNPQSIKTFQKRGFRIKGVKKDAGSVVGGIEMVRMLLKPAVGDPRLFLLKGDAGCELLAKRLSQYHWLLDSKTGDPTDVPDDKDDDELDALRYMIMTNFGKNGRLTAPKEKLRPRDVAAKEAARNNAMVHELRRRQVMEHVGEMDGAVTGKAGGFFFDL